MFYIDGEKMDSLIENQEVGRIESFFKKVLLEINDPFLNEVCLKKIKFFEAENCHLSDAVWEVNSLLIQRLIFEFVLKQQGVDFLETYDGYCLASNKVYFLRVGQADYISSYMECFYKLCLGEDSSYCNWVSITEGGSSSYSGDMASRLYDRREYGCKVEILEKIFPSISLLRQELRKKSSRARFLKKFFYSQAKKESCLLNVEQTRWLKSLELLTLLSTETIIQIVRIIIRTGVFRKEPSGYFRRIENPSIDQLLGL